MDEEATGLYRLRNLIRNNIPLYFLVISEHKLYHFQAGLFVFFFFFFGIEIIFLLNEKYSCSHGLLFGN